MKRLSVENRECVDCRLIQISTVFMLRIWDCLVFILNFISYTSCIGHIKLKSDLYLELPSNSYKQRKKDATGM